MRSYLETKNLTKQYGSFEAVKDMNIHIDRGEIYGLIGPNGAGKTTLMKMLVGFATPTSGEIEVAAGDNYLTKVGCLIESPGIYGYLNAFDNMKLRAIGSLISFITFEVMLHTVFGIAMMALYEITRNTIIPTIITIFGSANLHGMLISFLETKLVSRIPAIAGFMDKYGLSRNFIVTKTEDLGISGVSVSYVNIIVVIVIGLILYSVMGTFIFTKRDTI